ncbi:M24 family metallopeptidase, partial [Acinetobacter baumannii]
MILTKEEDIEMIRRAGRVAGETLHAISLLVKPGISTWEIDQEAERLIRAADCIPTFLGYRNFPATVCTSVNEEV